MWPAVIAAAAAIGGGILSNRAARKQAEQEQAVQREFAQNSIQWKTADAKAAGVHPLYAIGTPTQTYSPITYSDSMGPALASAGQSIARGYAAQQSQKNTDRQYNKSVSDSNFMRDMAQNQMILEQQRLQAEIQGQNMDNSLRQMQISAYARGIQASNSQQDLEAPGITTEDMPLQNSLVQEKPSEITSKSKDKDYKTAGTHAGWMDVDIGPFKVLAPSTDEGWGEDLGITKLGVMAAATLADKVYNIPYHEIKQWIRENIQKLKKTERYRSLLKKIGRGMAKGSIRSTRPGRSSSGQIRR
ncbi:hypothetical protein [Microviridae sp.]|nr:hypothetical protein [Microviridae sp.]